MSLNDLHPIRRLCESQARLFVDVPPAARPKKVLIYSMDPWQLGVFEQFLHLALLRKGHRPVCVYYDGLLPLCAWENAECPPPPLETLVNRFRFIHQCFGIDARGISTYMQPYSAQSPPAQAQGRPALGFCQISSVPNDRLHEMVYADIPVGRIALRDLFQYTLGAFEPRSAEDFSLYRRHLLHAVMSVDLAHALLDAERPDVVVMVNGKSVMYSYLYEVCRRRGVRVVTWEEGIYFDDSVVLAHNDRAIDFPITPDEWEHILQIPIGAAELREVDRYFLKWRNQEATHYVYYDREDRDVARIRRALSIPAGAPVSALFPNIIWDTNALEKDRAFDGMMDWVFTTIDFFAKRRDEYLVIRAHPGELRLKFRTRTPIASLILDHYGDRLPPNVRVIDAASQFSSYEIARDARICAVYTSTLGVEFALMGLSPVVCGVPFYAGWGLTHDVATRAEYLDLLDGRLRPRPANLDHLRRFLHAVIFRLVKRPEFFDGIHGHPQQPRIVLESFEGFPESLPIFNGIVECILTGRSFLSFDECAAAVPAPVVAKENAASCPA